MILELIPALRGLEFCPTRAPPAREGRFRLDGRCSVTDIEPPGVWILAAAVDFATLVRG
jgi:hypothetical protein